MPSRLDQYGLAYFYDLYDTRGIDGAKIVASACLAGNILAILTTLDPACVVKVVIDHLAPLETTSKTNYASMLTVPSGLRHVLGQFVRERLKDHMSQIINIPDNEVLAPVFLKGQDQSR